MTFKLTDERPFSDWFGSGDTFNDIRDMIETNGAPEKIFIQTSGYMAALVYPDKVICVGYDGNEYHHTFEMDASVEQ